MIKKELLNALDAGMSPEDIIGLLAEASKEHFEKKNKARLKGLKDAIVAYIGPDHAVWNTLDQYEVANEMADFLEEVIDEFAPNSTPVVNSTEQKCNCAADCSCDEKIEAKTPKVIGKIATYDENGKRVERDLTMDDVDDVLNNWLKFAGLK